MTIPDDDTPAAGRPLTLREVAAMVAMHGELVMQGNGVYWINRKPELAKHSVEYADELVRALEAPGSDSA